MQVIPQFFWDSMSDRHRGLVAALEDDGLLVFATGSRLICPRHVRPDSDWDVYFMADYEYVGRLATQGGWEECRASGGEGSVSIKNGTLNAIVFADHWAFDRFKIATDFCAQIGGPTDKVARVELFERIKCESLELSKIAQCSIPF